MTPPRPSTGQASSAAAIRIADDFSRFPGGRYRADGPFSGEAFREEYLVPRLQGVAPVKIILKGTAGYGSSFLEEAFGGLVRVHGFNEEELKKKLIFDDSDPSYHRYINAVWKYIEMAQKAKLRQ